MAISSTYLSNPTISINAVDLTDQCTSAVINYVAEQLENTTFSKYIQVVHVGPLLKHRDRNPLPELRSCRNRSQHLQPCRHHHNARAKAIVWCNVSATNPEYTLTGAYLSAHTPINASLGELSTIDLTFSGGVLAKAVA
jgi:hypothetical protein